MKLDGLAERENTHSQASDRAGKQARRAKPILLLTLEYQPVRTTLSPCRRQHDCTKAKMRYCVGCPHSFDAIGSKLPEPNAEPN